MVTNTYAVLPCEVCEVEAMRTREAQWLLASNHSDKEVATMQFYWRFQSHLTGEFVGLKNSLHRLAAEYRRSEVKRALSKDRVCVDCNCDQFCVGSGMTPLDIMVYPERRQEVYSVFGGTLTVQQLVALPGDYVVWRNADKVCVVFDNTQQQILLSNHGTPLGEYLAAMVSSDDTDVETLGIASITSLDMRQGCCYLKLFKPEFKYMAFSICGCYPKFSEVFAVPQQWYDWDNFASLYVTKSSLYHIDTEGSEPLVPWLSRKFAQAIAADPDLDIAVPVGAFDETTGNFGTGMGGQYVAFRDSDATEGSSRFDRTLFVRIRDADLDEKSSVLSDEYISPHMNSLITGRHQLVVEDTGILSFGLGTVVTYKHVDYGSKYTEVAFIVDSGVYDVTLRSELPKDALFVNCFFDPYQSGSQPWYDDFEYDDDLEFVMRDTSASIYRWPIRNLDWTTVASDSCVSIRRMPSDFDSLGRVTTVIDFHETEPNQKILLPATPTWANYRHNVLEAGWGVTINGVVTMRNSSASLTMAGRMYCESTWLSKVPCNKAHSEDWSMNVETVHGDEINHVFSLTKLPRHELSLVSGYCYTLVLKESYVLTVSRFLGETPPLMVLLSLPWELIDGDSLNDTTIIADPAGKLHLRRNPLTEREKRNLCYDWGDVGRHLRVAGRVLGEGTLGKHLLDTVDFEPSVDVCLSLGAVIGQETTVYPTPVETAVYTGVSSSSSNSGIDPWLIASVISITINVVAVVIALWRCCVTNKSGPSGFGRR